MLTPIKTSHSPLHEEFDVTLTFGIGGVRGGENEGELQAKFGGRFSFDLVRYVPSDFRT